MVDVAAVPERLVNRVGEPEVHQVLDGFLAEVMVDAEDVFFGEGALQVAVELLGAFRSLAERLFDDQPAAAFRPACWRGRRRRGSCAAVPK